MQNKRSDNPKNVCLYHDKRWRGRFQNFINQIRVHIVPVIHLHRFQKFVCTCKTQEKNPMNFNEVLSKFSINKIQNADAREFLEYLYGSDIWNEQHRSRSAKRLVYLLECALREDFGPIDRVDVQDAKLHENDWSSETVTFTVKTNEPRFMGFFIGQRGQNIKQIARKFGCQITLKESVHGQGHTITAVIKYLSRKPLNLKDVSQYLEKEANRIAVEREYCQVKTLEYYRKKAERQVNRRQPSKDFSFSEKMSNIKKYEKRFKNNNRHHHGRKESIAKLDGSRCLNCLVGYTTPLFKDTKCTHHPGYIVADPLTGTNRAKKQTPNHRWTCCDLVTQTATATVEEHTDTGCTVGFHNWRPAGKQDRREMKSRIACVDESTITVQAKSRLNVSC